MSICQTQWISFPFGYRSLAKPQRLLSLFLYKGLFTTLGPKIFEDATMSMGSSVYEADSTLNARFRPVAKAPRHRRHDRSTIGWMSSQRDQVSKSRLMLTLRFLSPFLLSPLDIINLFFQSVPLQNEFCPCSSQHLKTVQCFFLGGRLCFAT